VTVFDTESHTAIGSPISVGLGPQRIAISPDGSRAYVTNQADNTVSVIDTDAGVVVDTIAVGGAPFAITISPDGTRAYVSSVNSATVSVLRL
jgi:YVTN family beta-propeller protein